VFEIDLLSILDNELLDGYNWFLMRVLLTFKLTKLVIPSRLQLRVGCKIVTRYKLGLKRTVVPDLFLFLFFFELFDQLELFFV